MVCGGEPAGGPGARLRGDGRPAPSGARGGHPRRQGDHPPGGRGHRRAGPERAAAGRRSRRPGPLRSRDSSAGAEGPGGSGEGLDARRADRLLGRAAAHGPALRARTGARRALHNRLVFADVSDLSRPENRFERRFGKLLEVYLPIDYTRRPALALRGLPALRGHQRQRAAPLLALRAGAGRGAAAAVAGAAAAGLVARPPAAPAASANARRCCEHAIDSSALERRRIAQHLHDGVVQDLAGVSYALAATGDRPSARARPRPSVVRDAAAAARRAVRELQGAPDRDLPAQPAALRAGRGASRISSRRSSARGVEVEADIEADLGLAPETRGARSSAAPRRRCATSRSTRTRRTCRSA